jgi:uncharacterized protein involved in outer membrane biogenesis
MRRRKNAVLRASFWFFGGLFALLVIAALIVSLIRIPIDLSGYKGLVESTAADALGRSVTVDGNITVTTSLWPTFEIAGIRIANPEGFDAGDLAKMDRARIRVALWPLLEGQVRIKTFQIDGLALNLVRNEYGAVNWALGGPAGSAPTPTEEAAADDPPPGFSPDAMAIDDIVLENISATFRNLNRDQELNFAMDRAVGSAALGETMRLQVNGVLLEEPYTLRIEADSLGEFLALARSRMQIDIEIAETRFHLAGSSEALGARRTNELDVRIEGKRLDSLDGLLRLDLPPLGDYRLGAHLTASPGRLELSDLEVTVGDNTLNGAMTVDRTGARPAAKIQLTARTIQLADFDLGGWSPDGAGSERPTESRTGAATADSTDREQQPTRTEAKLLSPEALQRADLKLEVRVNELLSGDDTLGGGALTFELKNGRLAIDPLQLRMPSSSLLLKASVKPGAQASAASLRVLIENFDFGALMRLSDPDTDLGGTLSLDIDVTARASDVRNLLTGASGYLDVAGTPENFRAGIVDLWAVNLLSSVVSASAEGDDASKINCIISRWSLQDGVMTAQNLAVDTSKIRICGQGNIDFNDQSFDLLVAPVAKRPEFFSLATPLTVKGSFEDFRIGPRAGVLSVGTTAVKFAISPVTTPLQRLLREDLPEDGADICALPIGPHAGELAALPGC